MRERQRDLRRRTGDDIIQFKDPKFKEALLIVKEYRLYLDEDSNEIDEVSTFIRDIDTNKDGEISVNEAKKIPVTMICLKNMASQICLK